MILIVNALSAFRLALAAMFPLTQGYWQAVLIVVVAVSDGADGFIARRFDAATWVGGLLDAIADKVFILVVLGTFLAGGELQWWEVILLLSRDFVVAGVAAYVAGMRLWSGFKQMPARMMGKLTTAAMLVLILLLAIWGDERTGPMQAALVVTIILSMLAGLDYFTLFLRSEWARRNGHDEDEAGDEGRSV